MKKNVWFRICLYDDIEKNLMINDRWILTIISGRYSYAIKSVQYMSNRAASKQKKLSCMISLAHEVVSIITSSKPL